VFFEMDIYWTNRRVARSRRHVRLCHDCLDFIEHAVATEVM